MMTADEARAAWARKAEETEQARQEANALLQREADQARQEWATYTGLSY